MWDHTLWYTCGYQFSVFMPLYSCGEITKITNYVEEIFKGHTGISDVFSSAYNQKDIIAIYSPVYQKEEIVGGVVGIIEIKIIGVHYPIINEFRYDLLKIAPCKFFGPNPNEVR